MMMTSASTTVRLMKQRANINNGLLSLARQKQDHARQQSEQANVRRTDHAAALEQYKIELQQWKMSNSKGKKPGAPSILFDTRA